MIRLVTPIADVQIFLLNALSLNLGWVNLFMGVVIGSAILIPLCNMMTWTDASTKGSVLAAWGGFVIAVVSWLIDAQVQGRKITMSTLSINEVMLSGNLIVISSLGFIYFAKFVEPQKYNFDTLDANIQIRKTKRWVLLWPLHSIPAQVFTYFAFWVVDSIAWGFCAAIVTSLMKVSGKFLNLYAVMPCEKAFIVACSKLCYVIGGAHHDDFFEMLAT
jgi:hypothetical protein